MALKNRIAAFLIANLFLALVPVLSARATPLPAWTAGTPYGGGDRIQNRGQVYECKPWPYSGWCAQVGYEPGGSPYWQQAWILIGPYAEPTATATPQGPVCRVTADPAWRTGTRYVSGARVQHRGRIFLCKPWPYTGWCGQRGYEPGVSAHWRNAWNEVAEDIVTECRPFGDYLSVTTPSLPTELKAELATAFNVYQASILDKDAEGAENALVDFGLTLHAMEDSQIDALTAAFNRYLSGTSISYQAVLLVPATRLLEHVSLGPGPAPASALELYDRFATKRDRIRELLDGIFDLFIEDAERETSLVADFEDQNEGEVLTISSQVAVDGEVFERQEIVVVFAPEEVVHDLAGSGRTQDELQAIINGFFQADLPDDVSWFVIGVSDSGVGRHLPWIGKVLPAFGDVARFGLVTNLPDEEGDSLLPYLQDAGVSEIREVLGDHATGQGLLAFTKTAKNLIPSPQLTYVDPLEPRDPFDRIGQQSQDGDAGEDSDGDGMSDADERGEGSNPDNPDTDGDGLLDGEEEAMGTDQTHPDSDDDGADDGDDADPLDPEVKTPTPSPSPSPTPTPPPPPSPTPTPTPTPTPPPPPPSPTPTPTPTPPPPPSPTPSPTPTPPPSPPPPTPEPGPQPSPDPTPTPPAPETYPADEGSGHCFIRLAFGNRGGSSGSTNSNGTPGRVNPGLLTSFACDPLQRDPTDPTPEIYPADDAATVDLLAVSSRKIMERVHQSIDCGESPEASTSAVGELPFHFCGGEMPQNRRDPGHYCEPGIDGDVCPDPEMGR